MFGTTVKVCIKFGHLFQELMDRTAGPCLISSRFGVPDETDDLATRLVIINRQGERKRKIRKIRKQLSTFSSLGSISQLSDTQQIRFLFFVFLLYATYNLVLYIVCVTNYIRLAIAVCVLDVQV
jgi:hypothetical protein